MKTEIDHWVCVSEPGNFSKAAWPEVTFPTKGRVYTMRKIWLIYFQFFHVDIPCCLLNEIVNQPESLEHIAIGMFDEPMFPLSAFRKLERIEFDLELTKAKELENVD